MGRRAEKRRKARLERKKARQDARNERVRLRQETTQYMASQGMRKGQIVGDLVSKGLDLAGSKFGATSPEMLAAEADLARAQKGGAKSGEGTDDTKSQLPMLAAIGAGLYLLMGKKKR